MLAELKLASLVLSCCQPWTVCDLVHTLQQHQWALLKAIGVIEEDKGTRRRGKVSRELPNPDMFYDNIPDMPGSLGARLEDMNKDLLTVRNAAKRGGGIVCKGGRQAMGIESLWT